MNLRIKNIVRVNSPRYIISVFLIVIGILFLISLPKIRVGIHTFMFIPAILPGIEFNPQELLLKDPIRKKINFRKKVGWGEADLYIPRSGDDHSAVLLFLGVNPAGRDDPRVVQLARGLSRTGTIVMIPWSSQMTNDKVIAEEIDDLVRAFQHLMNLDNIDVNRIGMGGFCVGASLSAVAAQDSRINDHVKFLNFFGGYFNAIDLVKSVVTETRFYSDVHSDWRPNELAVKIIRGHLIETIPNVKERELFTSVFLDSLDSTDIDYASLSEHARVVYKLMANPSINEIDAILHMLPEESLSYLAQISPLTKIDKLKARVLIMHDAQDYMIPSEESKRFRDMLTGDRNSYYTEFSMLNHMDPTGKLTPLQYVQEGFKLYLHLYHVIEELV